MFELTVRGFINFFRFLCDVMLRFCLARILAPTWKLSEGHRRQLVGTWTQFRLHTLSNFWQKKKETMPSNTEESPVLRFAKLTENATTPTRGSKQAAGYDLYSAYDSVIPPMGKAIVQTDIQIAVPKGHYGRVAPRSGLAAKHFIDVGAGVIDEDYRGNVGIVLFNFNSSEFKVNKGDRIAQLICERISYPSLEEVDSLDNTERGDGGFGSSGKN